MPNNPNVECSLFYLCPSTLSCSPFHDSIYINPSPPQVSHSSSVHSSLTSTTTTYFSYLQPVIPIQDNLSIHPPIIQIMPSIKALLAASSVTFAAVNAHMVLLTPPPYGNPSTSPLLGSGGDFPCKSIPSTGGQVTEMAIGSQQQLSFKGSAVHGGGSCQVSLTTDANPTKQSKWQVIYSVLGGCPSKSATGNLPENPDSTGSDKYDYKIPPGVKPGNYVLAWTWFNKIGNREMYMNCANVKITGGSSKRDTYPNATMPTLTERDDTPSFPDMFVAQIPTTVCLVPETTDAQFPDPGQYVDKFGVSSALKPPTGAGCKLGPAAAGGSGGSANGGASGGATSSGGATNSGSTGGTDGSAAAGSPSAPSAAASPEAASPSPAAASAAGSPEAASPSSASSQPISNSSAGSTSSGSPSTSTSCTSPGQSICSPDGKQVGECSAQLTVSMIPVPEGAVCKQGMISWPRKRSFGHARRQHSISKWNF